MLKDSSSYERQIIDAVRSVNKALGGTYGTSSAIYKSEFNQYEVQLIDAIKGIGRTLSGKGLSVVAGSGSAIDDAAFQNLSRRVTKLENESFFRLVDGNVTLKEDYQNLWVPGWLAAGGVGSGSGGGGVSFLKELTDVYHDTGGVLRADGTAAQPGDSLIYNTTLGWLASPVSGGGGSGTVTGVRMNGTTLSPSTGGVVDLGTVITSLSGYATQSWVNQQGFLTSSALSGYATRAWVQQQGYLTSYTETDPTVPAWAKQTNPGLYVGTTRVQTSSNAQDLTGILSVKASTANASKFEWDSANEAWHFYGNVYADGWVAAGGVGSGSGGGGGSNVSWGTKSGSTRPLTVEGVTETLLLDGALSGYATQSWVEQQGYVTSQALNTALAGYATNLALAGKQDKYPFTITGTSGATYALGNFVTLDGTQTITGAKTFSGGITMSGANILPSADDANSLGSNDYRFDAAFIRNIYTSFFQFRDGTTKAVTGNIAFGDGYLQLSLAGTSAVNYMFYSTNGFFKQGGGVPLGRSDHRWSSVYSVDADLSGDLALASSSHIDIGDARLEYDSGAKALHVTCRSGSGQTIGLFADGFLAAGGVAGQSNVKFVTLDGDQIIEGEKTFTDYTEFSSSLQITGENITSGSLLYVNGLTTIAGNLSLTGTLNGISVSKDNYGYGDISIGSRLYIQTGSNDLLLGSGSGKVIVGGHPGGTAIGSNKFYVGGTAIATTWNTTSDRRLKDEISLLQKNEAIEKLMALAPSTWKWNSGSEKGKMASGFIAQEMEGVLPFMVSGGDYKGIAYQMLHAYEVSAIQSHEERIRVLEKENAMLRDMINTIRA